MEPSCSYNSKYSFALVCYSGRVLVFQPLKTCPEKNEPESSEHRVGLCQCIYFVVGFGVSGITLGALAQFVTAGYRNNETFYRQRAVKQFRMFV